MTTLAVVTGGSAGIGSETAIELARAGLEVLAVARRETELAATAAAHKNIRPVVADVTTPAGRACIADSIGTRAIAALVLGAGVFPRGLLTTLSPEDWQTALETNLLSRLHLVLCLRGNLQGGRVLFIGSDAASNPRPGGAAYSVSKAASAMLWRCLVGELGEEIGFAMAKPGLVATSMMHDSLSAPRTIFPAGAVYEAMQARGEIVLPTTVAKFFRFLLLDTKADEFSRDIWDIRDRAHHQRWLHGSLYVGDPR